VAAHPSGTRRRRRAAATRSRRETEGAAGSIGEPPQLVQCRGRGGLKSVSRLGWTRLVRPASSGCHLPNDHAQLHLCRKGASAMLHVVGRVFAVLPMLDAVLFELVVGAAGLDHCRRSPRRETGQSRGLTVGRGLPAAYCAGIVRSQIIDPNCHPSAKTHHRSSHETTIDRGQVWPKCGHGVHSFGPCRA
jgi:hypothetical protein